MDQESDQRSFMQKHKFTLISLFIILLAAIPLLLLSNSASKKSAPTSPTTAVSPTASPLTTENVQPTMTQLDANMQQSLTQIDSDLNAAASVNTAQDSTSGL